MMTAGPLLPTDQVTPMEEAAEAMQEEKSEAQEVMGADITKCTEPIAEQDLPPRTSPEVPELVLLVPRLSVGIFQGYLGILGDLKGQFLPLIIA
jgi:hypothetical protein